MENLPGNLLTTIFNMCDQSDLAGLRLACKPFRAAVGEAAVELRPAGHLSFTKMDRLLQLYPCVELLKLDHNLVRIPFSVTCLRFLKTLHLHGHQRHQLRELPDEIGRLTLLENLIVTGYPNLQWLPEGASLLTSLKHLNVAANHAFEGLAASISALSGLQSLNLAGCGRESPEPLYLPESISDLARLSDLDLGYMNRTTEADACIGALPALEVLNLQRSDILLTFPAEFTGLASLKRLILDNCYIMSTLPDVISQLPQLEDLDVSHCHSLKALPDDFGDLGSLTRFDASSCSSLANLPPSFSQLSGLKHLVLNRTSRLDILAPDALAGLSSLETLSMDYSSIGALPESVRALVSLRELSMRHCRLHMLSEHIVALTSLQKLTVESCGDLQAIVACPSSIMSLCVACCHALGGLPNMEDASQLHILDLSYCQGITIFPLGSFPALRTLNLTQCPVDISKVKLDDTTIIGRGKAKRKPRGGGGSVAR